MAKLTLDGVSKRFGDVVAVEAFSLEVARGELLALVGPSGCGKTTALRLIAGFERPDRGDIRLDGRSVLRLPPERRGVGIVFQNYALFPHMDVQANISYGLKFVKGRLDRRARVRELLELVDLPGLEGRRPDQLSAGQRQRVALARSLAPRPQVLLLDEPLSALDAALRERLRVEIKRIQRRLGITTIYVTHDQEDALAIADRVAVMRRGRLEQVGPPQEVYNRPQTAFVAEFVGRGNLFEGRVRAVKAPYLIVELDDEVEEEEETIVRLIHPSHGSEEVGPGRRVRFLVRPERLRLGPGTRDNDDDENENENENILRAAVQAVEYLGALRRYHLSWGGRTLIALQTADSDGPAEPGDDVRLRFDPQSAWVLPEAE